MATSPLSRRHSRRHSRRSDGFNCGLIGKRWNDCGTKETCVCVMFAVGGGQFGLVDRQFQSRHGRSREIHPAQRSPADGHQRAQQSHVKVAERLVSPHRPQPPGNQHSPISSQLRSDRIVFSFDIHKFPWEKRERKRKKRNQFFFYSYDYAFGAVVTCNAWWRFVSADKDVVFQAIPRTFFSVSNSPLWPC